MSTDTQAAPAPPVDPLIRKVDRILNSKAEVDPDVINALETVSAYFTDNTTHNRRNLRRMIEQTNIDANQQFFDAFTKVKQRVDTLAAHVGTMHACCEQMGQRLTTTQARTRRLISHTTNVQNERQRLLQRQTVVNTFIATFSLSADERAAIVGSGAPDDVRISPALFAALARCRHVHEQCRQLLQPTTAGADGGEQTTTNSSAAAIDIMDEMARLQETGIERLYRYVQRECRQLTVDVAELNPMLPEAFYVMQQRPTLFKYLLDEYCTARRNNTVRAFIDTLTRGGHGTKPIEVYSHDTARYVADMLAHMHQALATEYDLLVNVLLKKCDAAVLKEHTSTAMAQITDGLCRPFKMRVEQSLSAENGPVVLYRLNNVCMFYEHTMVERLTSEASLLVTMSEMRVTTQHMFQTSLNSHIQRTLTRMSEPGPLLQPSDALHQVLLLLRDVLQSHDVSTLITNAEHRRVTFTKLYAMVLEPVQSAILLNGARLSPVALAVYVLNSLHSIRQLLALLEYTQERVEMLQAQITVYEDVLVSEQSGRYVQVANMHQLYDACMKLSNKASTTTQPTTALAQQFPANTLLEIATKLDMLLAQPDTYWLSELQLLTHVGTREQVRRRSADVFCTAYRVVYVQLTSHSQYTPDVLQRIKSPEQVEQLLN